MVVTGGGAFYPVKEKTLTKDFHTGIIYHVALGGF